MGLSATLLAVRRASASRWRASVFLLLLFGVAGGGATALLAVANDVDGAFIRLLDEVDSPDFVAIAGCEDCSDPSTAIAQISADPAVEHVEPIADQSVDLVTADGLHMGPDPDTPCATGPSETSITTAAWSRTGRPPVRLLEGRLPEPGSTTEIVLPEVTARRSHVGVGDTVTLLGACSDGDVDEALALPLEVVGIGIGPFDVKPPGTKVSFETVYADPALNESLGFGPQGLLAVWLRDGASIADLDPSVERTVFLDMARHGEQVESSLSPDATALRLLALLGAIAAIAVLGQLLVRHELVLTGSSSPMLELGARRRDIWSVGAIVGSSIAIGAAIVCAVAVVLIRPFVPEGVGSAMLHGGAPSFAAIFAGCAVTLSLVALIAAVGSLAGARRIGRQAVTPRRPFGARLAEALRLRPPATLGVRLALEPGHAAAGVPVRTGLGAIALALTAVIAAVTFGANLDRLREDTRFVGWNWDIAVYTAGAQDLATELADDIEVDRATFGTFFNPGLALDDDPLSEIALFTFDTTPGSVQPQVTRGRAPAGPNEVLLAPDQAARLGLELGDTVPIYQGGSLDPATPLTMLELVGIGVLPVFGGRLDTGAAMTFEGLQHAMQHLDEPTEPHAVFIDLASDTDLEAFTDRLGDRLGALDPDAFAQVGSPITSSEDLVGLDLSDAGWVPAFFANLMVFTGVAVLAHLVVTGASARRRDLAISRALGFVSRSVRTSVAVQAVTLVLGAALVGVPIGLLVGQFAWIHYAEGISVVPDATTPWSAVGIVLAASLLIALVVSIWPAARILRQPPVEALRAE